MLNNKFCFPSILCPTDFKVILTSCVCVWIHLSRGGGGGGGLGHPNSNVSLNNTNGIP